MRTDRLAKWLRVCAVAGLAAVAARNSGLSLGHVWDNAYELTEFVSVAAIALRATRTRGAERAAWSLLTLGLLGFTAGDLYYDFALANLKDPPFPSFADAGYLSIYPAAYAAIVLVMRARTERVWAGLWLDGIVTGLAAAAIGAALVLGVVASTDGPTATVVTNLAYPLGDLTLLAFVIAVLTITGRRAGATWILLALAFGVWAVADTIYLYQAAAGTYREYTILDTAWPAAYVLIAFAAWSGDRRVDARRLRGRLLALPAAATLAALALLVLDHYAHVNECAIWLACAAIATAVARFAWTFRQNLRMLDASEHEAMTDPLTRLGNRRALIRDLQQAAAAGRPVLLALFDLDGFKAYNDTFGHPAGDALLARLGARLAQTLDAPAYRMGGDEFCVLAEDEHAVAAAADALSESGERFSIRCSFGAVRLPEERRDPVEALRLADQRMYANKRSGRRGVEEAIHQVLLRVAAEHDGELREHVDDVALLAEAVGRELALEPAELLAVRRAATLHDIGKIAIPDGILHAPRALTEHEWQYMRQHTIIGARIIAAAPELDGVAEIVRSSHERYDGGGYPDRLEGDSIPLGARIVSVCDAYDAMVTDRVYRAARTPSEALEELRACAGTQFDPRVVEAFTAVVAAATEADAPGRLGFASPPHAAAYPGERVARGVGRGSEARRAAR